MDALLNDINGHKLSLVITGYHWLSLSVNVLASVYMALSIIAAEVGSVIEKLNLGKKNGSAEVV